MEYIISEMRPIYTVEKPSFRRMIKRLSGGVEPPYATCFKGKLSSKRQVMEYNLRVKFSDVEFVCTTADIWSSNHKSFMGVTGHYIDPSSLKRVSVLLACQRMKFKHTFTEIAAVLFSVYSNYDLYVPKLVGTVTDNASNFGKAFKVFHVPDNVPDEDVSFLDHDFQKTIDVEAFPHVPLEDQETILDSSLPRHYKCFAHTLNLVATTDSEKALKDAVYKKRYNSSIGTCCALWNKLSRSTQSCDYVEERLAKRLPTPCPTRWNSFYDCLLEISNSKEHLPAISNNLGIPSLKATDLEFITEYLSVMRPVALALDILQGEEHCYLGLVLPTLYQIKLSLSSIDKLEQCRALKAAVIQGLDSRFSDILILESPESRPYILATISLPKFKLHWWTIYEERETLDYLKSVFLSEAEKYSCTYVSTSSGTVDPPNATTTTNEVDPFFTFLNAVEEGNPEDSTKNRITMEVLAYLENRSRDVTMLHLYPVVKAMFLKYNTILPSSAAVERAFSSGGQIQTPRRNRLDDTMFETILMLKYNQNID